MSAMAVVSNVYRAANAVRNHLERTVLAPHGLTWTGWVVLWVIWIWGEIESRHVAAEAGRLQGHAHGRAEDAWSPRAWSTAPSTRATAAGSCSP